VQEQSSCNHEEELKATAARQFRVESRQKGKGEAINIRGDGDSRKACEMKPLQSQKQQWAKILLRLELWGVLHSPKIASKNYHGEAATEQPVTIWGCETERPPFQPNTRGVPGLE